MRKAAESCLNNYKTMENKPKTYVAIDLKSFYASVECMERKLDPMTTNLVVADPSRTEKTICLAVSPSLKTYGVPGRPRLFEVVQKVKEVYALRKSKAPGRILTGSAVSDLEVKANPSLALDYITAKPQMALYLKRSTEIYRIYLNYIAPEDIHVYSIDEVFMDVTPYLSTYGCSPRELALTIIRDVLKTTGITATAGIGTNLYLCKIAMDIGAKRIPPDKDGVRIAELDEMTYRKQFWTHRPLTDFWRVGKGYRKKLEDYGMFTMGDVARCSINHEDLLYKLFGINAELLIDHAWGWEPCTMADIKAYKPQSNCISSGQVLQSPYPFEKSKLVVREMAETLAMDMVKKGLVTDQIVLTLGYDIENLRDPGIRKTYDGPVTTDSYGRSVPKAAHGTINLRRQTSSTKLIVEAVMKLFESIVNPNLLARRVTLSANRVIPEREATNTAQVEEQLNLFTNYTQEEEKQQLEEAALKREKRMQQALLNIQEKYGKNAILKGMNLLDGGTTIERNDQIGGHKA